MLAGTAVLWLASAGAAQASIDVTWSAPGDSRQTLTVTVDTVDDSSTVTLYVTYRHVDNANNGDACPATMAANNDVRLFDGIAAGPEPYSIARSVSLVPGLYAVCIYVADPASSVLADAALSAGSISGQTAPVAPRPTAISFSLLQAGTDGQFSGAITGTATGKVLIQRRANGRWLTVKSCRAIHGRFSTRASVRHGARYRARLVATKAYAGIASWPLRAR